MKYSTFLRDTGTDLIFAVVISERTTPNDIERIVKRLRNWCDNEVDV